MREIKFRAWHKEQEKMYSAEEMGRDQLTLMPDGRGFANISGKDTGLSRIDNGRRMIPLQYTGLKDSKGREIYEGDIFEIQVGSHETNFVEFYEGEYFLNPHGLGLQAWNEVGEVIGNIYENPKLLERI